MILVTGAGGLIGRHVARALGPMARARGHAALDEPGLLDGIEVVIHAGRDSRLGTPDYRLEGDVELALARRAAECGLRLLTLSSRKVYAPSERPLDEASALGPTDRYGQQKLAMEEALEALLGPRLTRLRIANVFGFEPGRPSFMGRMLDGLARDATITFDMSPFTTRDFLDAATLGRMVAAIAHRPPGGILNVGSGVALPTGRLALALIEGFGRGRLVVLDAAERDVFVLDCRRLMNLVGPGTDAAALLDEASRLGLRLSESARP
ncbi:MAG: SDR family oxidoreductase [Geminicoccaceae bacterium]